MMTDDDAAPPAEGTTSTETSESRELVPETTEPSAEEALIDDQQLVRDGERAVDRYVNHRRKARDQIIPAAIGFLAARRLHPSNKAFSAWLDTSPYSRIGSTDRAALIHIGEHLDDFRTIVANSDIVSPRRLWTEYARDLQTLSRKSTASSSPSGKTPGSISMRRETAGSR